MAKNSISPFPTSKTIVLLIIGVLCISALHKQTKGTSLNNINWDGYGYYLYLPALFIYKDCQKYEFVRDHMSQYKVSDSDYQLIRYADDKKYPRYNIGLSLIWTPFFLTANFIASSIYKIPQDSLSAPYQWSIIICHLLFIVLGFVYLRKFLLNLYNDKVVGVSLFLLALATNLYYYTSSEIALTHSYLFSLLACFLFQFYQYKETETKKSLIWSCLLFGLMVLIRSSELLLIIIPFFYKLNRQSFKSNFFLCLKLGLTAIAFIFFQLLFYKVTTGTWLRNGYGDRSFDLLDPHIIEGLLSYARGWLVYTPLMLFVLLGIPTLLKIQRNWFLPILICLLANIYILFSWDIWWYGDTFGSRPMVQHYAYLSIPLAAFISWLQEKSKVVKYPMFLLLAFTLFLNLFQTWQYDNRILPLGMINKEYYWASYLKATKDNGRKVLIDVPESKLGADFKEEFFQSNEVISSFGKDQETYQEFTTIKAIPILADNLEDLSSTRIGIEIEASYIGDSFGEWDPPKLVTQITRGTEIIKWTGVRIPIVMNDRNQDVISYNFLSPELMVGDKIQALIWNTTKDQVIVRSFKLQTKD